MHEGGYMLKKYQPDRAIASTWHPMQHNKRKELAIQEDETAIVVFMMGEYYDYCGDHEYIREMYDSFIKPAADFMAGFTDTHSGLPHASYDLWEQKFMTHTYTMVVVYGVLKAAIKLAEVFEQPHDAEAWSRSAGRIADNAHAFYNEERGNFRKGFLLEDQDKITLDNTLDMSSTYGVYTFGYPVPREQLLSSIASIEKELLGSALIGGVPRYEYDGYFAANPAYKGNPWFVTTLWLAQYYVRTGDTVRAWDILKWCIKKASPSGTLAEQIHPDTGYVTGVLPLVWSHAELANTILDLSTPG